MKTSFLLSIKNVLEINLCVMETLRKIAITMDGERVALEKVPIQDVERTVKSKKVQKSKPEPLTTTIQPEDENYPPEEYLKTVSQQIRDAIKSKKLTKSLLEKEEFTSILRLASLKDKAGDPLFPQVHSIITQEMGYRPLPIKLYLKDKTKALELHKHQVLVIKHMISKEKDSGSEKAYGLVGSILNLEMGLGKTLLSITESLIAPRPSYEGDAFSTKGYPTLVIASKIVMNEWKTEGFQKFFGDKVKVLYYHKSRLSPKAYDSISREQIVEYDFVITTYDAVVSAAKDRNDWEAGVEMGDVHTLMARKIQSIHPRTREQASDPSIIGHRILFHTPWERVIADESQRFSNPTTAIYKSIMAVYGKYKHCLTGTPIRNKGLDIWSQLRWCGYNGVHRAVIWKRSGLVMMREHKLNRYILSLNTKDTDIVLPKKIVTDYTGTFEGKEKEVYDYVLKVTRMVYDEMMAKMANFASVLALFTRLRQLCIAPYLITAESKREKLVAEDLNDDNQALEKLNTLTKGPLSTWIHDKNGTAGIRSTKMQLIIKEIKELPKGEKILIFSMFTSCLDLVRDAIHEFCPDFIIEQLDGDTKDKERASILDAFKNKPAVRGLLMSYKVGSEGLNLTESNHVICVEPWWTPTVGIQSEGRAHRPGQTKEVQVHRIYIKNSIEDRILKICSDKAETAKNFLEGTNHVKPGLDKYTLGQILGR
jgi:SNF2 family DNA or RNA helicase